MIDVLIPALDRCYDFELDGEMPAEKVVEEMIALVEKKEKIKYKDALPLCSRTESAVKGRG